MYYSYSFLNLGSRMEWVVNATLRPLYPRERPDIHSIGDWVSLRAGPDGWENFRPPKGFDPRTARPIASRYTDWAIAAHSPWHIVWKCGVLTCFTTRQTELRFSPVDIIPPHPYSFTYHPRYRVLAIKNLSNLEITVLATWTTRFNNRNLSFCKECQPFELLILQKLNTTYKIITCNYMFRPDTGL